MGEIPREEEPSKKQYPVRRVCSYCGEDMGEAGFMVDEPEMKSHGICKNCLPKVMAEIEALKEKNKE